MAALHRNVSLVDKRTRAGGDIGVLQGVFVLRLDVIFAALDFIDDGGVVLRAHLGAKLDKHAMGLGENGAVVFRLAAKRTDLLLQALGNLATLGGAALERRCVTGVLGVFRRLAIAFGAVDRGLDEVIEDLDVVVGTGHGGGSLGDS